VTRRGRFVESVVAGSVVAGFVATVGRTLLRPPETNFVEIDAEHSVAFRLATSLPDPLDRLLSVGRRRWSRRVAPYPARAVSLLVALVATLQLVQLLRTTAVVTRGVALWLGLLALSTVGLAVRVDGHALRETATGRFVTAVLVLPREPGDD